MPIDENTVLLALVVLQLQRLIPLLKDTRLGLSRLLQHFKLEPLKAAPAKPRKPSEAAEG